MLLEISSPLIVSPILGHSIDVWAMLIALSIGGLALGYFLGGYISSKGKNLLKVLTNLFLSSCFLILLGWALVTLNNSSSTTGYESLLTWSSLITILFFPLVLFGATTPVLISLINKNELENIEIVGKIFSISTVGGILFSILTGYFLIPNLGIRDLLLVAAVLTAIIPMYIFYIGNKKVKTITLAGLGLVCLSLLIYQPNLSDSNTKSVKILDYSEGINGQLITAEIKNKENTIERILFINRMGQTWINMESGFSIWSYPNFITSLGSMYPKDSRALVLGLGGGIVAKQLNEFIGFNVDGVEIDPRIIEIAKNNFGLNESKINLIHDDARRYVKTTLNTYEVIVLDIFNGEITPSHGLSYEAFKDIQAILTDNGIVIVNFNGYITGKEGLAGRSLLKTLKKAGFDVKIFPTTDGTEADRNNLFIAYLKQPDWSKISAHVKVLNKEHRIADHFLDESKINLNDALLITDDFPVMEQINKYAAAKWRESYLKNFTLKYKKEFKIPLIY